MSASLDPRASSDETAVKPAETRTDATERFTPGTLLAGRYRIVSPLGKGGMGEVYRADDIRLGQPVALKFLPTAFAADSGRLQRLVDEVRIGRQISHPNVCRLYDSAEAEGLTLDWSAWYAGRSFAVLGFFAVLMVAAAYTSLGGKPVFGKALLDE